MYPNTITIYESVFNLKLVKLKSLDIDGLFISSVFPKRTRATNIVKWMISARRAIQWLSENRSWEWDRDRYEEIAELIQECVTARGMQWHDLGYLVTQDTETVMRAGCAIDESGFEVFHIATLGPAHNHILRKRYETPR